MKKLFKIASTASIVLFGIFWILSQFNFLTDYISTDIRNIFVLIYLFTSLKYFKLELNDKKTEINKLKMQLKQNHRTR
ncbi:hypothetical protein [Psychroflexus sp. ALD_RP9]|uniref:hypothetical protein n=1 Tax=Psychroflexus sp. ALD_RP9 TaxID=2777186 RepID=UPI001A8EF776|nr:hypothetical protein [Psychroflexus sp. ALD_RP9]QSS96943.1 hypothetical protein IMZ30_10915 [Psychroflexus sp. ALD_RP9]